VFADVKISKQGIELRGKKYIVVIRKHRQEKAVAELARAREKDSIVLLVFNKFNIPRLIYKVIILCDETFEIRCAVRQLFYDSLFHDFSIFCKDSHFFLKRQ
jgi:hypothetical protein